MAVAGKKYSEFLEKYMNEGMSFDEAHKKAISEAEFGAVKAVKDSIEPKKEMTSSEAKAKRIRVQAEQEGRLKYSIQKKEEREGREKLSKMSIEELKELKVHKRK